MIRNTLQVLAPALSAVVAAFALSGCGQNAASTSAPSASTSTSTTTATADKAHVEGDGHAHNADGSHAATEAGHGHAHDDSADLAMIAGWFPGAKVTKKPFPFGKDAASHLSQDSGLKFTGTEGDWGIYEASSEGARAGMAVMTHADIPGGQEMHVDFAVDKKFTVTKTDIAKAPDEAKMKAFAAQFKGKKLADAWKVGQDLKATPGLPPTHAQIAADTVKKGLAILDSNFNAAHGHSASPAHGEAGHDDSQPHAH